jgi:isopenicillin N synthase-like dioxygenase
LEENAWTQYFSFNSLLKLTSDQWPPSELLPDFRPALEDYLNEITLLSRRFLHLVAEALDLPATTFDKYADPIDDDYSRIKIVKYPPVRGYSQGCGPHKDSIGLWTFLLQADNERGLQVLNAGGEWIDAAPIENTLVVNIAAGFEAITGGLCPATTHRVLAARENPRYSVPFFMGMKFDTTLSDLKSNVPEVVQTITGTTKVWTIPSFKLMRRGRTMS